jgi:hypothetical protein
LAGLLLERSVHHKGLSDEYHHYRHSGNLIDIIHRRRSASSKPVTTYEYKVPNTPYSLSLFENFSDSRQCLHIIIKTGMIKPILNLPPSKSTVPTLLMISKNITNLKLFNGMQSPNDRQFFSLDDLLPQRAVVLE